MTLFVGIIITAGVLIVTAYLIAGIQVRNEQRGNGSIDYSKKDVRNF